MNPDLKERILDGLMLLLACGALYMAIRVWPGKAHEEDGVDYSKWSRPDGGGSCCNSSDCHAAQDAEIREGVWWVLDFGKWTQVPPDRVLRKQADGRPHVCSMLQDDGSVYIICFNPPSSA